MQQEKMDREILLEKSLVYLSRYKNGIVPKNKADLDGVKTIMEYLNEWLYEIRRERKS